MQRAHGRLALCSRYDVDETALGHGRSPWAHPRGRELRGCRIPGIPDTCFGRSAVYDLDVATYAFNVKEDGEIVHRKGDTFASDITEEQKRPHRKREVDHRSVYQLILKNVKYVLK